MIVSYRLFTEKLTQNQKESQFNTSIEETEEKKERLEKKIQYSQDIRDPEKAEEARKKKKEEEEKRKAKP